MASCSHITKHAHTSGTGPVTTTPGGPCQNAIPNCDQYGKGACVGQYVGWAKANCPVYCQLCRKFSVSSIVSLRGTTQFG